MYRDKNNVIEDSFNAYLVEEAKFTDNEEYPKIPKRFISKIIPKKIVPFDKAFIKREDLKNTFICFYSRDITFERIRKQPKRYINFFKNCAGIIGFDFSIHTDMPIVKQKQQMNDNLSLTYYFGKQGIKVIPNIRYGIDELSDEFFAALPKRTLVAVGTHGFIKNRKQKTEWYCCIENIIKVLNPSGIIVYGPLDKMLLKEFGNKTKFYVYKPYNFKD